MDFVKKTISKNVLSCLIGFTDASLENGRFVQLSIVMSHRTNRVNLIDLRNFREVSNVEAALPLCDCQSIVGVALWKHKQLLSGCLCDIASRFESLCIKVFRMMPMNVASRVERRLRFLKSFSAINPLWSFS